MSKTTFIILSLILASVFTVQAESIKLKINKNKARTYKKASPSVHSLTLEQALALRRDSSKTLEPFILMVLNGDKKSSQHFINKSQEDLLKKLGRLSPTPKTYQLDLKDNAKNKKQLKNASQKLLLSYSVHETPSAVVGFKGKTKRIDYENKGTVFGSQIVKAVLDIQKASPAKKMRILSSSSKNGGSKNGQQNQISFDSQTKSYLQKSKRAALFVRLDDTPSDEEVALVQQLAQKNKDRAVVIEWSSSNLEAKKFLKELGIQVEGPNSPKILLLRRRYTGRFNKYIHQIDEGKTFKVNQVSNFIKDCLQNMHPKFYRSQDPLTLQTNSEVGILVGQTIDSTVFVNEQQGLTFDVVFLYRKATSFFLKSFSSLASLCEAINCRIWQFDLDLNETPFLSPDMSSAVMIYSRKKNTKKFFKVNRKGKSEDDMIKAVADMLRTQSELFPDL